MASTLVQPIGTGDPVDGDADAGRGVSEISILSTQLLTAY
jgi:hypothetical protein